MIKARTRYEQLTGQRAAFLNTAKECSKLTLPYLVRQDDSPNRGDHVELKTPGNQWVLSQQSPWLPN